MSGEKRKKVKNEKPYNFLTATKDDDLTGYEKEIKTLCQHIRNAETIKLAMKIFFQFTDEQKKKIKIL